MIRWLNIDKGKYIRRITYNAHVATATPSAFFDPEGVS
jgi:hypothetical protein